MKTISVIAATLIIAGCASIAVRDDDLPVKTALSIGLDKAYTLQITNRINNGIRTDYVATTSLGSVYNCYVTGGIGFTGRNVSDAVCVEQEKQSQPPIAQKHKQDTSQTQSTKGKQAPTCNALLKAASKC